MSGKATWRKDDGGTAQRFAASAVAGWDRYRADPEGPGELEAAELEEAKRQWKKWKPIRCVDMDNRPLPSLAAWLGYCQWCHDEFGAVPSGT